MLDKTFENYSVSHGTLNESHLAQSFYSFLKRNAPKVWQKTITENDKKLIKKLQSGYYYSLSEKEVDDLFYLVESLFDALDDIAPDGCYFGAHIGNGSDFGFWEYEEEE